MTDHVITIWHKIIADKDTEQLSRLLHDNVVFHSPVLHSPQQGKALTLMYLQAAMQVLLDNGFNYSREIIAEHDAALEFEAEISGIYINGIDLIHWTDDGRIDDFKVMIRPSKAIETVRQHMSEQLQSKNTL